MVFTNAGAPAEAVLRETEIWALEFLIRKLKELHKEYKDQQQPDKEQAIAAAATIAAVTDKYGQSGRYQSEDYTVKTTTNDKGNQVYTVRERDRNEVILQFEKTDDDINLIENNFKKLNVNQKTELANAAKVLSEEGFASFDADATYKTHIEKLGGLAPDGAKAVAVAYYADTNNINIDRYQFTHEPGETVKITDAREGFNILQTGDGKITHAMSDLHRRHFNALYEQIQNGQPIVENQLEVDVWGQEDTGIADSNPEQIPKQPLQLPEPVVLESSQQEQPLHSPEQPTVVELTQQGMMAYTAVELMKQYGNPEFESDFEPQRMRFQAEGYTVQREAWIEEKNEKKDADSVQRNAYSIRDKNYNLVASFEQVGDRHEFTTDHSTETQQAEFNQTYQQITQPDRDRMPHRQQMQTLGTLAPAGTMAVLASHQILDELHQDTAVIGLDKQYELSRDERGRVSIKDYEQGLPILVEQEGKIQQGMSEEQLQQFQNIHEQLKTSPSRDALAQELSIIGGVGGVATQINAEQDHERDELERQPIPAEFSPPPPSLEQLNEWLVAAQVLGRGEDQVQHIKQLGREAIADTGHRFKDLYQKDPGWRSNLTLSAKDHQSMQADVETFRNLKRQYGEQFIVQAHDAQSSSSEPIDFRYETPKSFATKVGALSHDEGRTASQLVTPKEDRER
jgi:hypothetical protein